MMADHEVASAIGMLQGLATSGDLVTGEVADFKKHASALAAQPRIVQVWAFDKKGTTVSAARPDEATSAANDPDLMHFIVRFFGGERAVSTVRGEGLTNATVVIAVPVVVDDRVAFGVAAEIHVAYLSKFLRGHWP